MLILASPASQSRMLGLPLQDVFHSCIFLAQPLVSSASVLQQHLLTVSSCMPGMLHHHCMPLVIYAAICNPINRHSFAMRTFPPPLLLQFVPPLQLVCECEAQSLSQGADAITVRRYALKVCPLPLGILSHPLVC